MPKIWNLIWGAQSKCNMMPIMNYSSLSLTFGRAHSFRMQPGGGDRECEEFCVVEIGAGGQASWWRVGCVCG